MFFQAYGWIRRCRIIKLRTESLSSNSAYAKRKQIKKVSNIKVFLFISCLWLLLQKFAFLLSMNTIAWVTWFNW